MTNVNLPKIKILRKQSKLTQNEMAEKLNLKSGKLYHDREFGRVSFSADEVAQLALIFRVTVESLYTENFFAHKITQNVIKKKGA